MTNSAISKRSANFVWDKETTGILINLYGQNIDSFQNSCKVQVTLWRTLVKTMKRNESIPQEMRDVLTIGIARRKWLSLQKQFKAVFYNPDKENYFPFFKTLNKLFSEYAESRLNLSRDPYGMNESANKTTEAEKTAYIMHLLDSEDYEDISLLRCEPVGDDKFVVKSSTSYSVANKVRKELAKLPKESVCVQEAKLKIVPNTPFNRQYQLSTILNQRNLSFNRRNLSNGPQMFAKKRTSSMMNKNDEASIINMEDDSTNFEVQALDECFSTSDISEVKHPEIKRIKMRDESLSRNEASSDLLMLEDEPISVLEVPSIMSDGEDYRPTSNETVKPKKLHYQDESLIHEDEPPMWFKSFISRYDSDMKKLDDKLTRMNDKLDKALAQRAALSVRSGILKIKNER